MASRPAGTASWLAGEDNALSRDTASWIAADTWSVVDRQRRRSARFRRSFDRTAQSVHRPAARAAITIRSIRPRAQSAAGDQRINSFGIGGEVEVRSGLLVQKQTITGPAVHVGLGTRTSVDVTRIVWPNGVPQAEFDPAIDQPIVAQQRLKGSCPWVFADDGTGMRFVTDFLWRSPLGLRINAQDTAGVTQTEDWVKIRGDQLVARERRLRRSDQRRALGNAFRRSRVAHGRRSSRRRGGVRRRAVRARGAGAGRASPYVSRGPSRGRGIRTAGT